MVNGAFGLHGQSVIRSVEVVVRPEPESVTIHHQPSVELIVSELSVTVQVKVDSVTLRAV